MFSEALANLREKLPRVLKKPQLKRVGKTLREKYISMKLENIFSLFFYLNICYGEYYGKRYDNYKLFRGTPKNNDHLEFFKNISNKYDVNFWKSPALANMPVDFTVHPDDVNALVQEANRRGIYLQTILMDVQEAFDNQTVRTYIRRKMDTFNWNSYFRLHDIYTWLQDLQTQYPDEITLSTIGQTLEKRNIIVVRLALKESKMRSTVIIEGGIHAREWISHAFVTYFIKEIVGARTSNDARLKHVALSHEWYFIPVLNPDGYEYTHTNDRMWRKNRRGGYGIDLNRNFDAAFGTVGMSKFKSSEAYCGEFPFSEAETNALRNFIEGLSGKLEYYMSFHSYGQLMIIPYAFSTKRLDNFDEMKRIGDKVAAKISNRHGTLYSVGTAYDTVGYVASGTSSCWVKKTFSVPYVATFELRDQGEYGFALPPELILPTCKETMDGILEMVEPKTNKFSDNMNPIRFNGDSNCTFGALFTVSNIILVLILK